MDVSLRGLANTVVSAVIQSAKDAVASYPRATIATGVALTALAVLSFAVKGRESTPKLELAATRNNNVELQHAVIKGLVKRYNERSKLGALNPPIIGKGASIPERIKAELIEKVANLNNVSGNQCPMGIVEKKETARSFWHPIGVTYNTISVVDKEVSV